VIFSWTLNQEKPLKTIKPNIYKFSSDKLTFLTALAMIKSVADLEFWNRGRKGGGGVWERSIAYPQKTCQNFMHK